jgi:hypothetical protein
LSFLMLATSSTALLKHKTNLYAFFTPSQSVDYTVVPNYHSTKRPAMQLLSVFLTLNSVASAFVIGPHSLPSVTSRKSCDNQQRSVLQVVDNDVEPDTTNDDEPVPSNAGRYDVSKLVGGADDGAGFNQFDPVLKATGFLSRRFGILGGLTIFAALAAVEGREIFKSFDDATPTPATNGVTITTDSGLKITDVLIGKGGSTPLPGYIIGIRAIVSVGDKVIYNTGDEKPIAFKLGQRPFQNIVCQGVEEGIKGMRVGGQRILEIPKELAPPGVMLPPGVPLTYTVELTEVLSGYF